MTSGVSNCDRYKTGTENILRIVTVSVFSFSASREVFLQLPAFVTEWGLCKIIYICARKPIEDITKSRTDLLPQDFAGRSTGEFLQKNYLLGLMISRQIRFKNIAYLGFDCF